ncbi:MAG: CoA transferase [Rhodospirillaceae bacterium]|nr:CoA transferase [Rhodospirillaceae bacterium]
MSLPLAGMKVIEMAAIGPVPFCGMTLGDMGAEVIRVDRTHDAGLGFPTPPRFDVLARGKRSLAVDLKRPEGLEVVRRLLAGADVAIEGFRPGTMERLGLGPEVVLAANPKLVFGRCSGWGDTGPWAQAAGHDINFLGLSGALAAMGTDGPPPPPLNLVGDFGGVGMHLAAGVLAALLAARATGKGQVVATSIAQGAVALMPMIYGRYAAGDWTLTRGDNGLDGGAPYYRCYETRDGRYMAVAPIEKKFYAVFLRLMGLEADVDPARQHDKTTWPATAAIFAGAFLARTQAEWSALFAGSDACVTPVLNMEEAPRHPQQVAARAFTVVEGAPQPAPGARFADPAPAGAVSPETGAHTMAVLGALGYTGERIAGLLADGIVACAQDTPACP